MKRAVFLDRDGTLNADVGYTHRPEDLRLLGGVVEGLRALAQMGFRLVVISNQSGVARGYFREGDVDAFNRELAAALAAHDVAIEAAYYCPYHPTKGVGPYRRESEERKPGAGMLRRAARELGIDLGRSYAIGDKKSDVLAGQAAGCTSILVLTGVAGREEPELMASPDYVARDLREAAEIIRRLEVEKG